MHLKRLPVFLAIPTLFVGAALRAEIEELHEMQKVLAALAARLEGRENQ